MTARQKIEALWNEGICNTYEDCYYMCIDMGEFPESTHLLNECKRRDNPMMPAYNGDPADGTAPSHRDW